MSRRRPLAADGRGQTIQDFATGIGVFVVAVALSLSLLPGFFTPFESPIESDQTAQAERVAGTLVADLTAEGTSNRLHDGRTDEFFDDDAAPADGDDLRERFAFGPATRVNVTLRTGADDRTVGDAYGTHAVAASGRVVVDDGAICVPTCRLVVRVW